MLRVGSPHPDKNYNKTTRTIVLPINGGSGHLGAESGKKKKKKNDCHARTFTRTSADATGSLVVVPLGRPPTPVYTGMGDRGSWTGDGLGSLGGEAGFNTLTLTPPASAHFSSPAGLRPRSSHSRSTAAVSASSPPHPDGRCVEPARSTSGADGASLGKGGR